MKTQRPLLCIKLQMINNTIQRTTDVLHITYLINILLHQVSVSYSTEKQEHNQLQTGR